jgi:tetratricopeptide (TPR) repeat protein
MSLLRKLFLPPGKTARTEPVAASMRPDGDRSAASEASGTTKAVADARALTEAQRFGEALALIAAAQATQPDDAELLRARAAILFAWERLREAEVVITRAQSLEPDHPDALRLRSSLAIGLGRLNDAEACLRKVVALDHGGWQSRLHLAAVLKSRGKPDEAQACFAQALEQSPGQFDCLMGVGGCKLDRADYAGAEAAYRSAIAIHPARAQAWNHLGVSLGLQLRVDEAAAAFEHALTLSRASGEPCDALVNLAVHLREAGRTKESLALFSQLLAQGPSVAGSLCYAHALLKAGHFAEGWSQYAFRWFEYPLVGLRPRYMRPVWAGQDLTGKAIVLHQEQGLGDTFQFVRYAPALKALGAANVLLRAEPALYEVAQGFAGIDHVLGAKDPPGEIDYWIPTLALPRAFGTDLTSIPANVPYLTVDPKRTERWAPMFRDVDGLKVGIAWAGSPGHMHDRQRSVTLDAFAVLGAVAGVRFYSLQKGSPAEQLKVPRPGFAPVDLGSKLDDFVDTAAVVAQLDLVICVDTAIAHLAGALGKPVWILIGAPPDFRWLEGREDTPWYPTARLFRQQRRGDWVGVLERVKAALAELVRDGPVRQRQGAPAASGSRALVPIAPIPGKPHGLPAGYSTVAETRHGIVHFFPHESPRGLSIDWYGEFLHAQVALLYPLIRPGAVVVEAGAGEGLHALALASAIGDAGHLILYETRLTVRRMLSQNLAANRIGNATVMRRVLGGPRAEGAAFDEEQEPLDELRLDRLDWLKLGAGTTALDILEGAADTIWRLRPGLFMAADDTAALDAIAARVKEFSYRCWSMHTGLFDPNNFNLRDNDIFNGRVALALLAIPEEVPVEVDLDGLVEL